MRRIITIIGPTASGKTSLAVRLSKQLNAQVIGLDSRQIYKGMSIGTAQPTIEEMDGIKHHLIGFQDPSDPISAGEYSKLVINRVKTIRSDSRYLSFVEEQGFTIGQYQREYSKVVHLIFQLGID